LVGAVTNLTVRLFIVTEMYYWEKKVYKVIADGAVDGDNSVADLVLAIRSDDGLTKWEKEALINKLWESF
jgi:hypothetical protein